MCCEYYHSFVEQIHPYINIGFYDLGGRDDSKLLIPATVLLRFMFTLAEMRVMFTFLTCDTRNDMIIKNDQNVYLNAFSLEGPTFWNIMMIIYCP